MPRSLRIQPTAKPKTSRLSSIVLERSSICHGCAATFEIDHRDVESARFAEMDGFGEVLSPKSIERLYDVYAARLATMRPEPPGTGWDGVFVAKQK